MPISEEIHVQNNLIYSTEISAHGSATLVICSLYALEIRYFENKLFLN